MEEMPWARLRAPELEGIRGWINSGPLRLEDHRGKAVMLEFWSYSCVNCLRALPYVARWHEKYSGKGLVVIGVHSPEFAFEKEERNVREAVERLKIRFPVALDSGMAAWNAYENRYWPARFLIDPEGYIAFAHFGEGDYTLTERAIQDLLGVKAKFEKEEFPGYLFDQSPETHAGYRFNPGLGSGLAEGEGGRSVYLDPGKHEYEVLYPNGEWSQNEYCLELMRPPGQIAYRFNAREANLILEPLEKGVEAEVYIDGKPAAKLDVGHPGIYRAFRDKAYREREMAVNFTGKVRLYALTFG